MSRYPLIETYFARLLIFCSVISLLSIITALMNSSAAIAAAHQSRALDVHSSAAQTDDVDAIDGVPWEARHGLNDADYQATFDALKSEGYRPVVVNGFAYSNIALYNAIWEKRSGPAWEARHGLTSAAYQQLVNDLSALDYRPLWVSGYTVNNEARFATIWEKRSAPPWIARHGLTSAQYQAAFDDYVADGYRPIQTSGYAINNVDYYTGIWEKRSGPDWLSRHGISEADYQHLVDTLPAQGYRPLTVQVFTLNNAPRFNTIWEKSSGPAWVARHKLTAAEYQQVFDEMLDLGYRPRDVSGYTISGVDYYAAIWEKEVDPFSDLPTTGTAVPELAVFDQTMKEFMLARQITAGTLTVLKDGEIVFERGYGWRDQERTTPLPPDALLRLASVVKPITLAAIRQLIAAGDLAANDRVFCLTGSPSNCILNITPAGTVDPRVLNVTIQHLMDHQGGWDRDASYDPMFEMFKIADGLGVASPPTKEQIVQYMLDQDLDFTPGTKEAYSNYGYLLLGLVIEEITGQSYLDYIQDNIFYPLCVPRSEVQLGRSLPQDRNAREPWYSDPGIAANVFNRNESVLFPDGGFYIEAMDAHGGLIASGRAIAKFLNAYWIDGNPRSGNGQTWWFYGSLPGTHTLAYQRSDGISFVALFNQRVDPSGLNYDLIKGLLDTAANSVTTWPASAQHASDLPQAHEQIPPCLFPATSVMIPAAGGTLISSSGRIQITFPADAVTEPISVTLTPTRIPVSNQYVNFDIIFALEAMNQIGQAVENFEKPVEITAKLPDNLNGVDIEQIKLYYWDAQEQRWQVLETIRRLIDSISAMTPHFSIFAVLAEIEQNPDPDPDPDPEPDPDPDPAPDNTLYLPSLSD